MAAISHDDGSASPTAPTLACATGTNARGCLSVTWLDWSGIC
jgi:hypothetical protein